MRLEGRRRSGNVEDIRGRTGRRVAAGGAVGGGTLVLGLVLALITGQNPLDFIGGLLNGLGGGYEEGSGYAQGSRPTDPAEDRLADMCSVVLADTEDTWNRIFRERYGRDYSEPKLVIFSGAVQSACGAADSSTGPFYCSGDQKVYIDLSFYEELAKRFGAPGDFAQAYVIAHEVGHHVQNELGILDRIHAQMSRVGQTESNRLSVTLELNADFLAGVWAHYADASSKLLEAGDLEEALNAASAIGDDAIQKRSRGYVTPETFNHGTSAQRLAYFKLGYQTGDLSRFDLFKL